MNRPPECVWVLVTDLPGWADWADGVDSASWRGAVGWRPGHRFRFRSATPLGGIRVGPLGLGGRVRAVDDGRRLSWTDVSIGSRIEAGIDLEPSGSGTKVGFEVVRSGVRLWRRREDWTRFATVYLRDFLSDLREASERSSSDGRRMSSRESTYRS